jgi:ATP-dependent DNA helicase RecQ
MDSLAALEHFYGFTSYRPNQREAVEAVLAGQDVFVLMPTGGGKSVCYAVPSAMMPGVTVVVSPLISLMKDQVDGLRANGIEAAFLNSSLDEADQSRVMQRARSGTLKLLYVAPERLVQPSFTAFLNTLSLNFFAIDEAHCISQWGHDFRPEYRQLSLLGQQFRVPIMALTATATEQVKQDIVTQLNLREPRILVSSFFRANLHYAVEPKQDVKASIARFIADRRGQAGIVYCKSRNDTERLAQYLVTQGIQATADHAGLTDAERQQRQEQFRRDEVPVIVATVAFGMGIDKPNVRFVLHESVPRSLEHYYQETGRAGRDGLPATCVMYFSSGDLQLYRSQASQNLPEPERRAANHKLDQIQQFCHSSDCRHGQLLTYFNEQHLERNCGACDNCLHPPAHFDATILAQKILSCVYRLKRPFSPTYISAVLTGAVDERMQRWGHDKLSVFGIVDDYPATQLRGVIRELTMRGLLVIDPDNYNGVSLTPTSHPVLRGEQLVELPESLLPRKKTRVKPVKPVAAPGRKEAVAGNASDVDQHLFEKLREVRTRLASEAGMPAYIVFADTSLTDMAIQKPTTLAQFSNIYGVGQQKLERYGQAFIEVIAAYAAQGDGTAR